MKTTRDKPDLTFNSGEVKVWFVYRASGGILSEIEYDNDRRIKFSTFLWLDETDEVAHALRQLADRIDGKNHQ